MAKAGAETARDQAQNYADQAYQTVFGDAITTALAGKVDKETGKGLSSNDFTDLLKTKLDGVAEGANNYSLPEATASTRGGVLIEDAVTSGSSKAVTSGAVFARIGNLKFAVSSSAPTSADENTITFVV